MGHLEVRFTIVHPPYQCSSGGWTTRHGKGRVFFFETTVGDKHNDYAIFFFILQSSRRFSSYHHECVDPQQQATHQNNLRCLSFLHNLPLSISHLYFLQGITHHFVKICLFVYLFVLLLKQRARLVGYRKGLGEVQQNQHLFLWCPGLTDQQHCLPLIEPASCRRFLHV